MGRIAGGKATVNGQAFALQAGDGAGQSAVFYVGALKIHRAFGQALPGIQLIVIETAEVGRVALQANRKTHLAGVGRFALLSL